MAMWTKFEIDYKEMENIIKEHINRKLTDSRTRSDILLEITGVDKDIFRIEVRTLLP